MLRTSIWEKGLIYINKRDKAAALEEYKILKRINPEMAEMLFKAIYYN